MGQARSSRGGAVIALAAFAALTIGCADDGGPAGAFDPAEPGVLTVATNLPAPGFWDGDAAAPTGGFEYALALALADRFDLATVRVVDVPFEDLVAGELGGADLALAQLTPTEARDEVLDFTTAYLDSHPAVIAREGMDVPDLAAARELSWAVQAGTTQIAVIDELIQPDTDVVLAADIGAVVDAVASGSVDAGLLDLPTALVQERITDGSVRVVAQFANDDGLAVAVPEGSDNLEALDSAVRALIGDGTVRELAEEHLGRDTDGTGVDVPLIRSRQVAP